MVSPEIPHQARLFLIALATGAGMLLIYDLFRIFRRVAKHETVWIAIEDMFFWLGCAFWLFRLMYRENDGTIRGFVILGAFLGMVLYGAGCSKWVVRGGTAVLKFIVKIFAKTFGFLFAPFRLLGSQMRRSVKTAGRVCKKKRGRIKKQLKKIWKAVKMGLCKL